MANKQLQRVEQEAAYSSAVVYLLPSLFVFTKRGHRNILKII